MTADTEKNPLAKNTTCLICDASVGVSTRNSCPIFHQNVTTSDKPVSKIIGFVLGLEIVEELVHSVVVCKKCFKLFNEIDELQERLAELRVEINGNYQRTIRKYDGSAVDETTKEDERRRQASADGSNKIKNQTTRPGPGRPRKIPLPLPEQVQNIIGASDEDSVVVVYSPEKESNKEDGKAEGVLEENDDNELEEEDMGDPNDTEYIPDLTELSPMERAAENGDVQIKLEVMDDDAADKILGKKITSRGRRKRSQSAKSEIAAMIPQMVVSRDGSNYTCLLCSAEDKFQSDAKGITTHLKECHSLRLYICDMCGQEFLKRNDLSAHLDEHVANEEGDFQCDVCNRIFSNLRLYRVHKRMHYPQVKNWTCDQCGKRYLSRNMLEEHMNTHTGIRPYACNLCGKDFASKYTFKAHEKTHTERPRPFACDKCPKTFLTQQNLIQHDRTHSGVRNYVCQTCGKSFGSSRNLEVHCVVHSGHKSFICRMCGKAFARKAEIRDHERTHTGEKPYQCEFCGSTFSQRSNLQSHKRATHYDDKRYKCMDCGKGFKRRRLLDYHMKAAHTGERPFKCPTCNATFIYPEHFKKHRRIHTGEKPFLCEVCGKAFNSRDNRNAHRFVHSDKKPYECLVCGAGFMRKPLLYNHMQTQGHLNDTIVVNQPRLTTDDDVLVTAPNTAEGMEMTLITDSEGNTKLLPADHVVSELEAGSDTKMYITELKEHVIIQEHKVRGDGTTIVGEGDEMVEGTEYEGAVEHLIIDGQVHFTNPSGMEALDGNATEIGSVAEITTSLDEGRHTLVVPATRHPSYTDQHTTTVQTEDCPVQLVQIRIPTEGENGQTWFNIVQQ